MITGLTQGAPETLAAEVAKRQGMTDKPLRVNLTFLPLPARLRPSRLG